MPETKQKTVWNGSKDLKRVLVPIDSLEPFPGNPRRGEVEPLRASLRRFGQAAPVTVIAGTDPLRIVKGHHVTLAAREEGWTHVAAIAHDFENEEEARAFLIADNRVSDMGTYDDRLLFEQLRAVQEATTLVGTGYSEDDLDDLLASLRRMEQEPLLPEPGQGDPGREPSDVVEVVLIYSPAQREQLETWLRIIGRELGADGVSECVYRAVELAARGLNQG